MNHATRSRCSTALWPSASSRNVFPVPEGPQTTGSPGGAPTPGCAGPAGSGLGSRTARGSQAWKVFPDGNPAVVLRLASAERSRPATYSAQQRVKDLGRFPALRVRGGDDFGAWRRRCGNRSLCSSASSHRPPAGRRTLRRAAQTGTPSPPTPSPGSRRCAAGCWPRCPPIGRPADRTRRPPDARTMAANMSPTPASDSTLSARRASPECHSPITGTLSRSAVSIASTIRVHPSRPSAPPSRAESVP